jgi:N6-L-threonylcarbamoyladenine synthase
MKHCLGIESTAHTFGAGIVNEKYEILSNEKKTFTTQQGGIKPSQAADHHYQNAIQIIKNALQKANKKINEINCIAYSQGPGLGPCLKVGATTARTLSLKHKKPLLGVNHCIAHIESGKKTTGAKNPIIVYASGANTQIITLENKRYRVMGETIDTGIGNLLDTFGREIGLGFPAGPKIDKMHFQGKKLIELPYLVKGMDLAFSGLLTATTKKIGKETKQDLSYSLMHTAFAMLCEVTERALAHTEKKETLLTGGVAASKALQQMMQTMCNERKTKLYTTPPSIACDNGAMIAIQGMIEHTTGNRTPIKKSTINQKYRTDEVNINWK